ncbi:MAG TPA: hypothetical protein VJI69_01445 [Bacteroidia bacterium]|nr:hypothetical protein [Bacteroidia bacterium]
MKTILFILSLTVSVSTATSCKTKKGASSSATTSASSSSTPGVSGATVNTTTTTMETTNTTASTNNQGAHAGKVSHKYRAGGCETVIIINAHDDVAEIVLIPKDKLNKDIDVDGQNITFDYHPLKMPQPAGCTVGIPAEITNITKLK